MGMFRERLLLRSTLLLLLGLTCFHGSATVGAIEITKLTVPRVVESGREGSFELDCQYRCNESDSKLVVKWFFNSESEPFYQWIAEMEEPVVGGRYEQKLGLSRSRGSANADSCNTNTWSMRLTNPTIEMSGKYRCEVLTLANQDSAEASMMVFAPPSNVYFNYTKTSSDRATLRCEVDGAFPMPHLKLYRILRDAEDDKAELVNVQLTTARRDGFYRALMTSEVLDNNLPQDEESTFDCTYSFKEIKFERSKRLIYVPGSPPETEDDSRNLCPHAAPLLWLMLLCLALGLS